MKLSSEQLERLALHSAFGLHLVTKWMAKRDDVDPEIRDRLRAHISAIEGVLVNTGHDWIREEIEATETGLRAEEASITPG
jgi:anti-sigma factor RsiW